MAGERDLPERMAALEEWSDAVQAIVEQLLATIDHMHDDLVALREWARIPRPACYPAIDQEPEEPVG
jgi:hypothetical protein